MSRARAFAAFVALALPAAPARPGPAVDFRLAQAVQDDAPTRVLAYLDVWDAASDPVADLPSGSVSGTLGDHGLVLQRLLPFRDSGQGVAYIFSVDISRSLGSGDFAEIRSALARWVDGMGPLDRAAVLVFGDQSRIALDFTADREALRSAIDALRPTDGSTVLYRGLLDALELSLRRDRDLPRRRVLVILSDGLDEGSGLSPEDVLIALRDRGLPLYAIGFGGPARRESLDLLLRFATQSGGHFVAAGRGGFADAYDSVHAVIDRVWLAELECPACAADGAARRLQINLQLGDRVLSKGVDLRLLPALAAGAPGGAEAGPDEISAASAIAGAGPAAASVGRSEAAAAVGPGTAAVPPGRWPSWRLLSVVVAAVLVVGGALGAARARARAGAADGEAGAATAPRRRRRREKLSRRERKQLDVPLDSEPMVPPVALCLTVVRGARTGEEHRFLLQRRGVVGSGGASDLVIDEEGLAREQVELYQERGEVWARALSRTKPTLINGVPLTEPKPLANDDLLGNRDFIVRVRLG